MPPVLPQLFLSHKNAASTADQTALITTFRTLERWAGLASVASVAGGITSIGSADGTVTVTNPTGPAVDLHVTPASGGGYVSLTGPGSSSTPGDLTQAGGFTVNDTAAHSIVLNSSTAGGTVQLFGGNSGGGSLIAQAQSVVIATASGGTTVLTNAILLSSGSGTIQLTGSTLSISSNTLLFFQGGSGPPQTVTGSRGGNAALASLLNALSVYHLITDSTTP